MIGPARELLARLPTLVLPGPPKCGTSSLYEWLTAHPDVRGSVSKETFYLMDPAHPLGKGATFERGGWEGYASLFPPDAASARVRVEATTHYLFQGTALEALASLDQARVVVVLRDPAERVLSSFRFTKHVRGRIAPGVTFREYVDTVLDGGAVFPRICTDPGSAWVLQRDVEYGDYPRHIEPWLDRLGPERVAILLFEDLVSRPEETVGRVARWLDLDPAFYDAYAFPRRNSTRRVRFRGLDRMVRRMWRAAGGGASPGWARSAYERAQDRVVEEEPGDAEALDRLRRRYEGVGARVGEMCGVPPPSW